MIQKGTQIEVTKLLGRNMKPVIVNVVEVAGNTFNVLLPSGSECRLFMNRTDINDYRVLV